MSYLIADFDSTVDGKKYKKGEILPLELASFPLAKLVEGSKPELKVQPLRKD